MKHNKPDIYINDKLKNKIIIVEVGITQQDSLKTVESETYRKYDLLERLLHKTSVRGHKYTICNAWTGMLLSIIIFMLER